MLENVILVSLSFSYSCLKLEQIKSYSLLKVHYNLEAQNSPFDLKGQWQPSNTSHTALKQLASTHIMTG